MTTLSKPITDTNWHLATMTVDTNGSVLYIDGVADTNRAWRGAPLVTTTTTPLKIGAQLDPSAQQTAFHFHGSLSDVRIYNRALGSNEVAQLYNYIPKEEQVTTDSFGSGANQFLIDFVAIGNPSNSNDTTGYGAVSYTYRIGKYDISQNQINAAVRNGLQNVVAGAWGGDQPAANVSWYQAAAYVNWLNTNSGFAPAYNLTWSNGSYSMALWSTNQAWTNGGLNLYRNANCAYFLPSENEWYKAAYYDPNKNNGLGGYWLYPTGSDDMPMAVTSGTNAGTAVYGSLTNQPASVYLAGGLSPYGTMGQGGNIWKWIESAFSGTNDDPNAQRTVRNANWVDNGRYLKSDNRTYLTWGPSGANLNFGFRVASIYRAVGTYTPPADGAAVLINTNNTYVGYDGSGNSLVVTNGALLQDVRGYIGTTTNSSNNLAVVTGTNSAWVNTDNLYVGNDGSGNSLTISAGGAVSNLAGYIGANFGASNSAIVTGSGSTWSNTFLAVGAYSPGNTLTVSNGGSVIATQLHAGWQQSASGNSVLVSGSNSSIVINSTNSSDGIVIGSSGSGNSMVISNGAQVLNSQSGGIGSMASASNNSVLVMGAASTWSNSAKLTVGDSGSGNSLTIHSGAVVSSSYGVIGNNDTSSSNNVTISGVNVLKYSGASAVSSWVSYTITPSQWNTFSFSNNSWGNMTIGESGSGNSLVVSAAGSLMNSNGVIGGRASSSNNSVLITGVQTGTNIWSGGSYWSNGSVVELPLITNIITIGQSTWNNLGSLTIGDAGSGALTVANGGKVSAANGITLASSNGSIGTLNIGSFGGVDMASSVEIHQGIVGPLLTPTIAFGSGSGTINFNQIDTTTISAAISDSGNGLINQLGSGTTILSVNNSRFLGLTTIQNGAIQFGDGETLGGAPVSGDILNNSSLVFAPTSTAAYTVAGTISGSGSLAHIGSGTSILVGSNSYTGSTLMNAGVLVVNGSLNSEGTVMVNGGALAGNGSVGNVTVNSGGTITSSGGAGRGSTLTVSSLIMNGGSSYLWNLNGSGANDLIDSTGEINFGNATSSNAIEINIVTNATSTWNYTVSTNFTLMSTVSGLANFSSSAFSISGINGGLGGTWSIVTNGTSLLLDYAAFAAPQGLDLYVGSNTPNQSLTFPWGTNTYRNTYVGFEASSSNNQLGVSGPETALINSNSLFVGYDGSGNTMVVSNGGSVTASLSYIGNNINSSNNTVVVTGSNSVWNTAGVQRLTPYEVAALFVGNDGSGNSLLVSNGGTVNAANGVWIGAGVPSSNNSVVVTGAGSQLNGIEVSVGGWGSSNSLIISDGGKVNDTAGVVGYGNQNTFHVVSSNNSALVTGAGSVWNNQNFAVGGYPGSGNVLTISNGGAVTSTSDTLLGANASSSNNTIKVTGAGSLLSNAGGLYIGGYAPWSWSGGSGNTLTVSDGGIVQDANATIGVWAVSSNNSASVTGAGSTWSNSANLTVGDSGSGNSLTINSGAGVSSSYGVIGNAAAASNNIASVTGNYSINTSGSSGSWFFGQWYGSHWNSNTLVNSSTWSNSGNLNVGNHGSGNSLVIRDGGYVSDFSGTIGAGDSSSNNSVIVSGGVSSGSWGSSSSHSGDWGGAGMDYYSSWNNSVFHASTWSNAGNLLVGNNGSVNVLVLSNGGFVTDQNAWIGNGIMSSNNKVVMGASGIGIGGINGFGSVPSVGTTTWANDGDLTIGNGGSWNSLQAYTGLITSSNGTIGNLTAASNNSATLNGYGVRWNNSGNLTIGNGGSWNSLQAYTGLITSSNGIIGNLTTASNNSATLNGYEATWNNSVDLIVGNAGSDNTLSVGNGAIVTSFSGILGNLAISSNNSVFVGTNMPAIPTTTFGGFFIGVGSFGADPYPSSKWINSGDITIGNAGSGNSMIITEKGVVAAANGVIGSQVTASNNSVLISGAQMWTNNSQGLLINQPTYTVTRAGWSNSGNVTIGDAGSGNSLTISGGGLLTSSNGFIGNQATSSNNSVMLAGVQSWTNIITNTGFRIYPIGDPRWGTPPSITYVTNITVMPSTWSNSGNLTVGNDGSGNSLQISDGGKVASANGYIGYASGSSNNSVFVTGSNSVWSNSSGLFVGYNGKGSLTVNSNATVYQMDASSGLVVGGDAVSQSAAAGILNLESGGSIIAQGSFGVGVGGGGTATLTGSSTLTVGSLSIVQYDANNTPFNSIGIGGAAMNNDKTVRGTNFGGNGLLVVSNGSTLLGNIGNFIISADAGYQASVIVTGTNSLIQVTNSSVLNGGHIDVGAWNGSGSLSVLDGASIVGNALVIASTSGTASQVLIDGAGSTFYLPTNYTAWTQTNWTSGHVVLGTANDYNPSTGNNILTISNGGSLTSALGVVGVGAGTNAVIITGSNSVWNNSGAVVLGLGDTNGGGSGGNGSLQILNGGTLYSGVTTNSGTSLDGLGSVIGGTSNSVGTVVLNSTNNAETSSWYNSGSLIMGNFGSATLTVANGANVYTTNLVIAAQAGSTATINYGRLGQNDAAGSINADNTTFGAGSWTANFNQTDLVEIGVNVSGNGVVNQRGSGTTVLTGSNAVFTGPVNIYNGSLAFGDGTTAGGSPGAGNILNNSTLVFAPASSDAYTVPGIISGTGTVIHAGPGKTALAATNTYTGPTLVNAGNLQVTGSLNTVGTVTVNSIGTLSGTGSVGNVSVNSGATITPGANNLPGSLSLQSALWAPGGNYNWVLNDASGAAGSGFSSLNIASALDLSQLSATNRFAINVSAGTNGVPLNFNGLVSTNWTIASFGSITNFSASNFAINTVPTNGAIGWSGLTNGTLGISTNGNKLELTYTAKTSAPPWTPPTGLRYSALIYAKVLDENGNPITAYGSKLAVFNGSSVAGVATPFAGPGGTTLFYLNVFANQSSVNGMTYQVYNAATGITSTLDETYNFASGVNTGTITNPIVLHIVNKQLIPIYDGWTWISFNVIPTDNTWASLLTRYQAADNDVIIGTKGSVTYYQGVWYPSSVDFKPEAGLMYMISSGKATTLQVIGSPATKPTMNLISGWNWVGCPGSSSTTLTAMMPGMRSSDNDVIISQASQMGTYWGGVWYNTTGATFPIVPGMGYLIYVAIPQSIPLQ